MKNIKQKAREMFDERFKGFSGKTEIWKGNKPPNHIDIKDFIDQIIDIAIADYQTNEEQKHIAFAVQSERERIIEMIDKIDFGLVTKGKAEVIDTLKYKIKNKLNLYERLRKQKTSHTTMRFMHRKDRT